MCDAPVYVKNDFARNADGKQEKSAKWRWTRLEFDTLLSRVPVLGTNELCADQIDLTKESVRCEIV